MGKMTEKEKRRRQRQMMERKRIQKRQKKGETAKPQEVESLKSITLTIESIAECMVPEKKTKIKSQKESLYG